MSVSPNSILQKSFIQSPVSLLSPNNAISMSEQSSLADVIKVLAKNNIGCVLLLNAEGKLSGIFSERDLILKRLYLGHPHSSEPVKSFMSKEPQSLKANASIARAIHLMSIGGFRHVPILQNGKDGLKIISTTDLFKFLHERLASKVLKDDTSLHFDKNSVDDFFLSNLAILKLDSALTVSAEDSLGAVADKMTQNKKGVCFVLDERGGIAGLFTERDFVKKVAPGNQNVLNEPLKNFLTINPKTLMLSASIAIAFESMVVKGFRHLPVVDNDEKLIGILSVRNFINYLANQIVSELTKK